MTLSNIIYFPSKPVTEIQRQVAGEEASEKGIDVRPDWQKEWESTIKEARKEGRVVIYTSSRPELQRVMTESLKKTFGLNAEWVTGRGAEIRNKLLMERRAGLHLADILIKGPSTALPEFGPLGFFQRLDPLIILPEIKDDKVWYHREIIISAGQCNRVDSLRKCY